jgi:RNA polymerase sigma-70 factor (ECF subfamily)
MKAPRESIGRAEEDDEDVQSRVEPAVLSLWQRGRGAWSTLRVPLAQFEKFIARLLEKSAAELERNAAIDLASASPDLYLACGCLADLPGAMALFEEQLLSRMPRYLERYRLDEALLADVKQRVRERLFVGRDGQTPKLAEYAGLGPLGAFVRIVSVRVALSLLDERQREPFEPQQLSLETVSGDRDPELTYLQARHKELFRLALSQAVAGLTSEQRNLLRLHLFDGLSIDKLGALFHIHRTTAARRLQAAREQVLTATRRQLQEALKLSVSEVDSLVRILSSQLDLSLSRIFSE